MKAKPTKLERAERETIIQINDADIFEGYFQFRTTKLKHWNKMCDRIGGTEKLLWFEITRDTNGHPNYYSAHIPRKYFSLISFGIKKLRHKVEDSAGN